MSHLSFIIRVLSLSIAILYGTAAHAQAIVESEPNNLCSDAQDIGFIDIPTGLPSTITGSLDLAADQYDVDFFAFQATANERLQVDLEGADTNAGTLSNPFLGLFNSACEPLDVNDDSGAGANSRLTVTVPADGKFVLGVSQCCDYTFTQGGLGSYLVTLDRFKTINSISGQLVSANTGLPISGSEPTFGYVSLLRCTDGYCYESVAFQQVNANGEFFINLDNYGNPLAAATYSVFAWAYGFDYFYSEQIDVPEDADWDFGQLQLSPFILIGSVSGRLVDADTGNPLSGYGPPYAYMYLQRCVDGSCYWAGSAIPDESGQFRFDGLPWQLPPGTYQLVGFAQDYSEATSNQFTVAESEDVYFGDFALTALPIQFGTTQACELPFGSETCNYSIEVTNRGSVRRYKGEAWSTVEFSDPTNNYSVTRFQVGRNGAQHPMPVKINLKQGQTETLTFQVDIPASIPVGSTVCATITVGQQPKPQFNTQGERFIFCSYKDSAGVVAMSDKEARKWLKDRNSNGRESHGGPSRTQLNPEFGERRSH